MYDVAVSPGADDTAGVQPPEGLRERKKRQMRELISDTATEMFLERGFDEVRVTEVAERCGVSEKTVYNYFPTKESLVLDREEEMAAAIRTALGPGGPSRSPVQATVEMLQREMDESRADWEALVGSPEALQRFMDLIESTPSLRAAQRDMMERLVQVAAEAMANRAGVSPDDPEPQIAATAIIGLWRLQLQAVRLYSTGSRSFDEVREAVTAEIARAARLIDSGLWAFEVMVQGRGTREQLKAAAEAAQNAGRQVAAALRQARDVWRQVQAGHHQSHGAHAAGAWGSGPWDLGGFDRQGARRAMQREREEWRTVQRELREEFLKVKRDQQRLLRETLRQQQDARRRGRPNF